MGGILGGGGGGSSSSSGYQTTTVRYAPYVEQKHREFLLQIQYYRKATIQNSPYEDYVARDVDGGFLGTGVAIASYGSLFTNFNTFMRAVGTRGLYDDLFDRAVNSVQIKRLVRAEGALMREDIRENAHPELMAGARDLNSVMSSTFIIGKANIEATRVRLLHKFSMALNHAMIPQVMEQWKTTLQWQGSIVDMHYKLVQLYYSAKLDYDQQNYSFAAKDSLWPFTVLDHERAAVGTLQGATNSKGVAGDDTSTVQKVIGGGMSGAAMGGMLGSALGGSAMMGAGIGAVLGGIASII